MANPRSKEVIAASDQRLIEVSAGSPSLEGTALISDASEMRRSQLPLDWLKSSGLLILTITGLILYIVFSVPATIFYDRLGTTPQEVGITYTSILSGSTLGALAVIGALLLILIYIIVMAFYATLITWMSQAFPAAFQNRSLLFKGDWELDANQFDDGLKLMKSMYLFAYGFDEQDWRRVEAAKRRVRSLRRLGVLTAEQTDELESLKSQIRKETKPSLRRSLISFFGRHTRPWMRFRQAASFAVVIVIVLPVLAFIQAGQVLDGESYFGSQLGIFDYRADPVNVKAASTSASQNVQQLTGVPLFLLGQNAQYVILYSPGSHSTIRIPVTAVIMTSGIKPSMGH